MKRILKKRYSRRSNGAKIELKKNSTPVTFEFSMSRSSNKINVYNPYKNIFEAMKLVDNTTVMITNSGTRLEHPKDFLSGQDYLNVFPSENHIQKQRKIFVCCQMESSILTRKVKCRDKITISTLLDNNTYIKYKKCNTYREVSISWLIYVDPVIFL